MNDDEATEFLEATLKERGIDQAPIYATWLIQGGFVVGRRFDCGDIKAVWLFEESELRIWDQTGGR